MTVNFLQSLRMPPTHTPQNKHTLLYSEVILSKKIVRMAHDKQEKRRRRKRRRRKKKKAKQW